MIAKCPQDNIFDELLLKMPGSLVPFDVFWASILAEELMKFLHIISINMFGSAIRLSLFPTPVIYQSFESARLQLHLHLVNPLSSHVLRTLSDQAHSTLFSSIPNYLKFNSHLLVLGSPSHYLHSPKTSETSSSNSPITTLAPFIVPVR